MSNVREESKKMLSKQSTPQLVAKLKGDKLIGISKEVAIEILEQRKQDVSEFKTGETKPVKSAETKTAKKSGATEKKAKTEKVEKPKEKKFPEYGKKVSFTSSKQSKNGAKKMTGTIVAKVKGSRNKDKFYYNIRTKDGVFQKSPEAIEFVED